MFIEKLQEERNRLEELLKAPASDIASAPQGSLRISSCGKDSKKYPKEIAESANEISLARFYHRESKSDRLGTYLPKDQLHIAQALAQKSYAEKFKKAVEPKLELINAVINEYNDNPLEAPYKDQNAVRQQLTKPYIISDEEIVRKWLAIPYEPNPKHPEERDQKTANGELVRSKSEVIIADNLKMLGIPYKYEAPLSLPLVVEKDDARGTSRMGNAPTAGNYTRTTIYPDFTCLNVKRRKLIYIEHFGLMDSKEYRNKEFFWKIRHFEDAGIIQGNNLIMTFEDGINHFNFSDYKKAIEELLL